MTSIVLGSLHGFMEWYKKKKKGSRYISDIKEIKCQVFPVIEEGLTFMLCKDKLFECECAVMYILYNCIMQYITAGPL